MTTVEARDKDREQRKRVGVGTEGQTQPSKGHSQLPAVRPHLLKTTNNWEIKRLTHDTVAGA